MHGLVSLLPEPFYGQVIDIWNELEEEYGLSGIKATPFPHFSWQIAEEYHIDQLEHQINKISKSFNPFSIHTAGIGIFTGPQPVIYINVAKNPEMVILHTHLWEQCSIVSYGSSLLYSPKTWIPHISLAYTDISKNNLAKVTEKLAFRSFNWKMIIDNIAFIFEPEGEIGKLKFNVKLKGNN